MTTWIKCSERMPEPGEDAHLVFGRFYGVYGVFDWTMRDGKWIWEGINGNDMTQFVTHWYVLPDAPKDNP